MAEHRFFDVTYSGDVLILAPHMRFSDLRDINDFQDELLDFLDGVKPRKLVVNFQTVTRTSSWFIGTMIRLERRMRGFDGAIKLCNMNKTVREVFHVTALDRRSFQILETLDEALAQFAQTPSAASTVPSGSTDHPVARA